jgi:hypothetical protein
LPFKRNLQRYLEAKLACAVSKADSAEVGLCRLNQVDPYPITYSLSNP